MSYGSTSYPGNQSYQRIVAIRWVSCVPFQILPKFSPGEFQDGGKDVIIFVAPISASFEGRKSTTTTTTKTNKKNIRATSK